VQQCWAPCCLKQVLGPRGEACNCRHYFDEKKLAREKRDKTISANSKVLKRVETKSVTDIAKTATVSQIREIRKVHWFEKFNWFITSEGYLVLCGRDMQQNELLVKRCAAHESSSVGF
jgi:predicted ribosome quality control (RQC) complex YloA/Tae2 family protein